MSFVVAVGPLWAGESPESSNPDPNGSDSHWAFLNLVRPTVPDVTDRDRVRTAIDAFVLARLEANGLGFSVDADPRTLIRRAYFDLVGLPPSPEEVARFAAHPTERAYQRIVDRLLASPHFGERWGRHWLDAAGYVDVYGADENAPAIRVAPGKWKYRDYVVRSFCQDKPYDQFVIEQLAGDEMVDWRAAEAFTPRIRELLVATGFLRTAIDDTDQDVLNIPSNRYATLFDTLEIVGTSLLGVTLQCARCHSHKFEPIPQEEFYRLTAVFTPAYNPDQWVQLHHRTIPDVSPREKERIEKRNAELQGNIDEHQKQIAETRRPYEERLFEQKLKSLEVPETDHEAIRAAIRTPDDKRSEEQKQLAKKHGEPLEVKADEVTASLNETDRATLAAMQTEIEQFRGGMRAFGSIQALFDTGAPPKTHLLTRGEIGNPGTVVQPGFLSLLGTTHDDDLAGAAAAQGETSGRRLALARWLTRPDTPASALLARVQANRVWHHLFGRGIVSTPGNLGRSAPQPTHPELVDYLAGELVDHHWRVKPLIRQIMTSTVYRQDSALQPGTALADRGMAFDAENHLLWRFRLRRVESEAIRDAMLVTCGQLDRTVGGPAVPLTQLPDGMFVAAGSDTAPGRAARRSLYVMSRRNYNAALLAVFDHPVMSTNCHGRETSSVVLQSLTMLNDSQINHHAGRFADRVLSEVPGDVTRQIQHAYQIALSRVATDDELNLSRKLVAEHDKGYRSQGVSPEESARRAMQHLCHMLYNTSEFIYVR